LDGTDDDDVVVAVAQEFQLKFLPAQHRLLDQHFVRWGGLQPPAKRRFEVFFFMYKATARATQCIRWADNQRKPDFLGSFLSFQEGVRDFRFGNADTD